METATIKTYTERSFDPKGVLYFQFYELKTPPSVLNYDLFSLMNVL